MNESGIKREVVGESGFNAMEGFVEFTRIGIKLRSFCEGIDGANERLNDTKMESFQSSHSLLDDGISFFGGGGIENETVRKFRRGKSLQKLGEEVNDIGEDEFRE